MAERGFVMVENKHGVASLEQSIERTLGPVANLIFFVFALSPSSMSDTVRDEDFAKR